MIFSRPVEAICSFGTLADKSAFPSLVETTKVPVSRVNHVGAQLVHGVALGSPVTQYTSHFRGLRAGGEMHVVSWTTAGIPLPGRVPIRWVQACAREACCFRAKPTFSRRK
jgi:hypothetical protein